MMEDQNSASILNHFSVISDHRVDRTKKHSLINIIVIAICAVICGADSFVEIEEFGNSSIDWLKTFLHLENGIPSHDTFGRVFSLIDPNEFKKCFLNWIKEVSKITNGEIVSIDGKTVRRSYDKRSNKSAIHLVSAWANANSLVLGQVKVDSKSNEITAIPELLKLLEIKGCIVTIDAMGCQKKIATAIVNKEADYILALKGNQGNLYQETVEFFENAQTKNFEGMEHESHVTKEKGHGREEIREYRMVRDIDWLPSKNEWTKLNSIGMVIATRIIDNNITTDVRYYISSLKNGIQEFANGVRSHWGIENKLHWVLDVQLREDDSRIRKENAPENFSILRHVALNLLRQEKSLKRGIKTKRLKAAVDCKYREKVLLGN
jgi:predicted transposase YbfD/YdcC